jgi:hypothetical protein
MIVKPRSLAEYHQRREEAGLVEGALEIDVFDRFRIDFRLCRPSSHSRQLATETLTTFEP